MGFIGIDRGLRDHWIYQDSEYLKVWMEMLFLARFSEEPHTELIDGDIIKVEYGQFIFGRIKWSQRLKIGEQRLRTLITKLKKEQMIELVSEHRKCSKYTIVNYAKFNHETNHQRDYIQQGIIDDANHQTNHLLTISQPSVNHQSTTKEQSKQGNKVKQVIIKTLYAEQVSLSEEEYLKLVEKYGNEESAKWAIDKLSNYKCSKTTKYKSDYHVLIGWVFDEFEKKRLTVINGGQPNIRQNNRGNKPNLPIIADSPPSTPLTKEQIEAIRKRARKLDGKDEASNH